MASVYESIIKFLYDMGNTLLYLLSNITESLGWLNYEIPVINITVMEALFGGVFIIYVTYALIKWVIPT